MLEDISELEKSLVCQIIMCKYTPMAPEDLKHFLELELKSICEQLKQRYWCKRQMENG